MEYVEFRYDIEVTAGSIGVREDRDYYVTSPIDFSYLRTFRTTDSSSLGTSSAEPYSPKTKSAEVMYLVTSKSFISLQLVSSHVEVVVQS